MKWFDLQSKIWIMLEKGKCGALVEITECLSIDMTGNISDKAKDTQLSWPLSKQRLGKSLNSGAFAEIILFYVSFCQISVDNMH